MKRTYNKGYSSELTDREQQIYDEIINHAASISDMAKKFCVKQDTVKKQILSIFIKKQVSNQRELIIQHYKNLIGDLYDSDT